MLYKMLIGIVAVTLLLQGSGSLTHSTPKEKPYHRVSKVQLIATPTTGQSIPMPLLVRTNHLVKPTLLTRWPEPTLTEPVYAQEKRETHSYSARIVPSTSSTPTDWGKWEPILQCESNGNWQANTGNGYYGGLQFSLRSWQWVGGSGYPHEATPQEQIHRAEKLLALQGWGAWPACSRKVGYR